MEPRNNVHVHINNIRTIFKIIRLQGPLSKRDLQGKTKLSWCAISTIVTLLIENGFIVSVGKEKTNVGRKPTVLEVQTKEYFTLGVELNSDGLTIVVVNLRGVKIKTFKQKYRHSDLEGVIIDLFESLDNVINNNLEGKIIIGIAFAIQGVVDSKNGYSVKIENIKNWSNVPLRKIVENRYSIDTYLLHDTDCLMYAEYFTNTINSENTLLIRMDYQIGLGMSLMLNGKVYTGNTGKSGEIGSMIVDTDENGQDIFLADYMFQGKFLKMYSEKANIKESITFESVAELARKGDELANNMFISLGKNLGRALVNSANIFNPELIVLNGSMTYYSDLFYDKTIEVFNKYVYEKNTKVKISRLDSYETSLGAALKFIDLYSNSIILNSNE